jgi:hypothetical protein
VDEKTGLNNMMYPDWQYWYWFRSVFFKKSDFVYRLERSGEIAGAEWGRALAWLVGTGLLVGGAFAGRDFIVDGVKRSRGLNVKALMRSVKI